MGHVPLSARAARSRPSRAWSPRVILIHINNTNPILFERSPERDAVLAAGVEIAADGLDVEL